MMATRVVAWTVSLELDGFRVLPNSIGIGDVGVECRLQHGMVNAAG
jgi:hypothetical protein